MKTKNSILIACMLLTTISGFAKSRTIEGNGKIITKEISIKDYDAISVIGAAQFEYEQSTAAPFFEISIDENILPYLDIQVKGKTLTIGYKNRPKDKEGFVDGNVRNYGYSVAPTRYIIRSNSTDLKDLNTMAGVNFIVNSPLKTFKIEASISGGGSIDFTKPVEVHKGSFSVAGSGDIILNQAVFTSINCSVAGSGDIKIKGSAERGNFNVAGGGDIHGYNCSLRKAECNVAGGGNIEVYATERLDANVAAGGKIRYKGEAEVSKSTAAGGSIKHAED